MNHSPATVVERLARRVGLLAHWMDADIEADWRARAALGNALNFDNTASFRRHCPLVRKSSREDRRFELSLVERTPSPAI